jgi:hypothetical protein
MKYIIKEERGAIIMEMKEQNVIIQVDSVNAWAVKELSYLYCDLLGKTTEISDFSIRKEMLDKYLTYLITCVQKLGKYSGVIYNNFYGEKKELETRVNHVTVRTVSPYAKDYKNINLFLGVLLDGVIGIANAIERHKFIVAIIQDTLEIGKHLKSLRSQPDDGIRLAQ